MAEKNSRNRASLAWKRVAMAALFVFSLAATGALIGGCSKGKPAPGKETKKKEPEKIVVNIGKANSKMTMKEIDSFWKNEVTDQQKMQLINTPDWQKTFLDEVVKMALMAEVAKKQGLNKTDDYKELMSNKEMLILAGLYYEKKIIPELKKIKVDAKDADAYYYAHKDEFFNGWREASQIVVADKGDADKLYEQLSKNPSGFAAAAKAKSIDDATKKDGGNLGKIQKNDTKITPEVMPVIFSTPKGSVSAPVQSRLGWHLIFIKDASPEDYVPLNDMVRSRLIPYVESKKQKEQFDKIVEGLKKEYQVKIDDKLVPQIGDAWKKEMEAEMMKSGHGGMVPPQMPKVKNQNDQNKETNRPAAAPVK